MKKEELEDNEEKGEEGGGGDVHCIFGKMGVLVEENMGEFINPNWF
jgi:hypothetical protein